LKREADILVFRSQQVSGSDPLVGSIFSRGYAGSAAALAELASTWQAEARRTPLPERPSLVAHEPTHPRS